MDELLPSSLSPSPLVLTNNAQIMTLNDIDSLTSSNDLVVRVIDDATEDGEESNLLSMIEKKAASPNSNVMGEINHHIHKYII